MYGVIGKIRQFNLPLECKLDLFDKIVVLVLLYGCEIWGFESIDIIERINLKFLKYIFNLKSSTPIVPLSIWSIEKRVVSFVCNSTAQGTLFDTA